MRRARDERPDDDHDPDDVPLHRRRPFGAGLKRQRVEFVRATDAADAGVAAADLQPDAGPSVEDIYAAIVLKSTTSASATATEGTETEDAPPTCAVCGLPVGGSQREHEASLAHQVSVKHSHPPSALDRSRMGLRALESQGWDPDARRGLGRDGEGVRFPIKTARKEDTLGVGATARREDKDKDKDKDKERPKPVTAKERRALEERERRRGERLQAEIYGRIDVDEYLRRNMD